MTDNRHFPPGPTSSWTCDQVRDELEAWALGALEPGEMSVIEDHLARCPSCRQDADSLRRAAAMLPFALAPVHPSTDTRHALMDRIATDQSDRSLPARRTAEPASNQAPIKDGGRSVPWSQVLVAPLAIALLVMTLWSFDLHGRVSNQENGGQEPTGTSIAMLPAGVQTYSLKSECKTCDSAGKLLADPRKADALFVAWNLDPSEVHQVWCVEGDGSRALVASLDVSPAGDVLQPLLFDQPIAGYSQIYVMSRKDDEEARMMGMGDEQLASPPPTPEPVESQ